MADERGQALQRHLQRLPLDILGTPLRRSVLSHSTGQALWNKLRRLLRFRLASDSTGRSPAGASDAVGSVSWAQSRRGLRHYGGGPDVVGWPTPSHGRHHTGPTPSHGRHKGQASVAAIFLVLVLLVVSAALVDIYRLQETRSWAYRTAESAALAGATLGKDLSLIYSPIHEPRIDPVTGQAAAEQVLLDALNRRGVTGASYRIHVVPMVPGPFPQTVPNFPPVPRADLWGASSWTTDEAAVGVYVEVPMETYLLGMVLGGNPVHVHAFAAAGVAER